MDVERSVDVALEQQAAVGRVRVAEALPHILARVDLCVALLHLQTLVQGSERSWMAFAPLNYLDGYLFAYNIKRLNILGHKYLVANGEFDGWGLAMQHRQCLECFA
jgi:hypothetical protein